MDYRPYLSLHTHRKQINTPKHPTEDSWGHPPSVTRRWTAAERATCPARGGPLPPGLHGGGGAGGHVWQRPSGGRQTPAAGHGLCDWGGCMWSSPVRRGGIHHPCPAEQLWHQTLCKVFIICSLKEHYVTFFFKNQFDGTVSQPQPITCVTSGSRRCIHVYIDIRVCSTCVASDTWDLYLQQWCSCAKAKCFKWCSSS